MKFYFFDKLNRPISYIPAQDDVWTQKKGQRFITTMRGEFWDVVAKIAGVTDVPEMCRVVITPTEDNHQTIGAQFTVSKNGIKTTAFSSSNDFSTTKNVKVYNNQDGTKKEVVSGSACHAVSMAMKRAKTKAIALAVGLPSSEITATEIVSNDFYLKSHLLYKIEAEYTSDFAANARIDALKAKSKNGGVAPMSPIPTDNNMGSGKLGNKPPTQQPQSKPQPTTPPVQSQQQPPQSPPQQTSTAQNIQQQPQENKSDNSTKMAIEEYVIPIGKHKGKTALQILNSKDKGYFEWAAENITSNHELVDVCKGMIKKYGALLSTNNNIPSQKEYENNKNKPAPPLPNKNKQNLRELWLKHGYETKTVAGKEEVRSAIKKALNVDKDLKWEEITEEQAANMLKKVEAGEMFKPKDGSKPQIAPTQENAAPPKILYCAVCNKELLELEAEFSVLMKDAFKGKAYCFNHQEDFLPKDTA